MGCRFAQDSAVLSKTRPEITLPAPEELRVLEAIVTRRTQILEMLTMERNRLGSTRDESARASVQAVIEFLESQVEDLNAQMADRPASSRVKSQAPTSSFVTSTQGFRSRTMALRITNNFRIHATRATFLAFPAPTSRS